MTRSEYPPMDWSDEYALEYARLVVSNLDSLARGEPEGRGHNRLLYALSRATQLTEWLEWRLDK